MRKVFLLVAGIAAISANVLAAPIDDAKKAIADKQYEKVDAILGKDLSQKIPAVETLRVSLDAAVASGRIITADKRLTALLKATENKDLDLLYQAAQVSDRVGDARTALVRYITFIRQSNEKSDKLEQAFKYVLRREPYADEYKKYVTIFGADDKTWALAQPVLNKLVETLDMDKALDIAEFLEKNFPKPDYVSYVHSTLRSAADSFAFGREPKDRYLRPLLVMVKGVPSDYSNIETVYNGAIPAMTDAQRVKLILDYCTNNKSVLSQGMLNSFGASARALPTDEAKLEAGKAYLALEPIFLANPNKEYYAYYWQQIGESPQVFNIKDKALISPEEIQKKLEVFKQKFADQPGREQGPIQWTEQNYLAALPEVRAAFLRANLKSLNIGMVNELLSLTKPEQLGAVLAEALKGRTFQDTITIRTNAMGMFNAAKDKAGLLDSAKALVEAYPGGFNWQQLAGNFIASPLLDMNEKIAFIKDLIGRAGYSPAVKGLLDALAADKVNWGDKPEFKVLRAEFEQKKPGSDAVMATLVQLAAIPGNAQNPNPALAETVKKFLASYQGKLPSGDDKITTMPEFQLQQIFLSHLSGVGGNAAATAACAELWLPRLPDGANWGSLTTTVANQQNWAELYKLFPTYVAMAKAGQANTPQVWNMLALALNPKEDYTIPFAEVHDKIGPQAATGYVLRQVQNQIWIAKPQVILDELAKIVALPGADQIDSAQAAAALNMIQGWNTPTSKVPPAVVNTYWKAYLTGAQKTGQFIVSSEAYACNAYGSDPKAATVHVVEYLAAVKTRTLDQQIDAVGSLFRWTNLAVEEGTALTPGMKHHTILKVLKPLYDQLPANHIEALAIPGNILIELNGLAVYPPNPDAAKEKETAAFRAEAAAMQRQIVSMWAQGAKFEGPGSWLYPVLDAQTKEQIAAGNWPEVNRMTGLMADAFALESNWDQSYNQEIVPLTKLMDDKKAFEPEYAFMVAAEKKGRPNEVATKQILMVKAKAATNITDMIPVAASDPSYDLFVAASALSVSNEARAWELTGPKIKMLSDMWESFDPKYVAWSVEQLRKQKMLKEGLEFAFKILLREADLDPEIGAKVSLTKGDIYRDQENYQAARIEYEALHNNARYKKTEAGAAAQFHLIDLYILTKNYQAAEQILERLVDADNLQTQAEAYYLYAKMSYQKNEFKESYDYVKKVKERVPNHVEATLLEGQLALVVPNTGLLSSGVLPLGEQKLATVVIPGRPLELTLQDPNLSVARGGTSIPVVLKTSKGGDEEHVKLLPSSTNKNLFTAKIATALGKAAKNDVTLQVRGDDVVTYEIEPDFQKRNDLTYPAKELEIKFAAKLAASAGEILTDEEEEKRELQRQMQRRMEVGSRRAEISRDGHTVRPGSKIYVQVTDFAQDMTDEADKVKVDLRTMSGDILEGFELTETGPHTGIFRGAVPTGIPLPKASASDTDEGKNPAVIIRDVKDGAWSSQPDGKKPKWIEVDTMTSSEVAEVNVDIPHLDQIKDVTLLGMLADDYEEQASFPARQRSAKGGVQIDVAPEQTGVTPEQIRRHVKLATATNLQQDEAAFDRASTDFKGRDGWMTNRVRGVFYLPENRALEMKFIQPLSPNNWQTAYLFIDGQQVLGNNMTAQTINLTGKVDLAKGPHIYEVLVVDHSRTEKVVVGYRTDAGTFEPVPADWFSMKAHPQLEDYLKPKAEIAIAGDMLTAKFATPRRLRKLRLQFNDFSGVSVAVKNFAIKDSAGKLLVPGKEDFTLGTTNSTLEIAPGDDISVTYEDRKPLVEDQAMLTTKLNSSYYNGSIVLAEEVITTNENNDRRTDYLEAKRCRPGDQLMVLVTDYDEDQTDQRDTLDVNVTTSSGEKLTLKALETWPNAGDLWQRHSGFFVAVLRIGTETKKDTIKVSPGDKITVSYLDKENTVPGIPVDRAYTISEAGQAAPVPLVYRTSVKMIEDTSPEAKAKLTRLLGIKSVKDAVVYKPLIMATHPEFAANAAGKPENKGAEIIAAVNAPLLFEVNYPNMALNAGSIFKVQAVAESELKLADKEKREPVVLEVPMYVQNIEQLAAIKGYPIQLQSHIRRNNIEMLRDGSFAGVIRLQVGSKGDPIDDLVMSGEKEFATADQRNSEAQGFLYRVPTLLVAGSDVVHIRVTDAGKNVTETKVKLVSDARLELMERTYTIQSDAVHLGEKFFVRVTDPDHDRSDDRDEIAVNVKSSTGDELTMKLTETLAHSGVFTGSVEPKFLGEKDKDGKLPAPNKGDDVLSVYFGDEVTFEYVDDMSLQSSAPVNITRKGKIYFGSDGELASFTKRFKDPEIAVKTNFLMAEALFELAKDHRKIAQIDKANDEIAEGKRILEEAMRDYPDTSLAVQGEYLLANLAQELGTYQEAIGRYSNVISTWPDSEYAPTSQFKKALCFEKLQSYDQACEEYVKLTYIYPDSPMVADATVRLGNYYYKKQSFKIAGKIFSNFQAKNPTHKLAPEALFLSAQCDYKLTDYRGSVKLFGKVVDEYPDEKDVRSEAMYWLADSNSQLQDYVKAYQWFKKLTWDYPESKWAKLARGRLTEENYSRIEETTGG
ncbi:MAG TPA: tetratricopeptide repeat protein [Tepidisphaeraceae bacterium]|jgi:TolA-binding protein